MINELESAIRLQGWDLFLVLLLEMIDRLRMYGRCLYGTVKGYYKKLLILLGWSGFLRRLGFLVQFKVYYKYIIYNPIPT